MSISCFKIEHILLQYWLYPASKLIISCFKIDYIQLQNWVYPDSKLSICCFQIEYILLQNWVYPASKLIISSFKIEYILLLKSSLHRMYIPNPIYKNWPITSIHYHTTIFTKNLVLLHNLSVIFLRLLDQNVWACVLHNLDQAPCLLLIYWWEKTST